ncbi:MAG TPA: hypothetical protein VJJ46_02415 [Anaerolineales bacterium]|nr:hypothetical protein [Anaerolineales bacterium]
MRRVVDIGGVVLCGLASRGGRCSAYAFLFVALVACGKLTPPGSTSTPTPSMVSLLPPPPHIGVSTLEEVFASAADYLESVGTGETVRFTCTIVEGTFCWFGRSPEEGPIPRELSREIIDQVGAGAIENARSNEVRIQCSRPRGGGEAFCEIDWGWGAGWRPLAVEP